jgi:Protein of unknown function (DUF4236)
MQAGQRRAPSPAPEIATAWRFQRRKKLLAGLTLNLGKRGASLSAGPGGAKLNVGRQGAQATVGLLGTGLSYVFRRRHP